MPGKDNDDREQSGDRGRRRERQNVSVACVFRERLSGGVRAHGVRQLFDCDQSGREDGESRAVGHGRPGRLRPTAAALLSQLGRDNHLLHDRHARVTGKRHRQMGAGSAIFLPEHSCDTGREQKGPPRSVLATAK